ncbi:DNA internalization-related competence protein ComEC/Rec2 [Comamonas endophytica]|uniref:DNA internalization-related competence protein ComEC/Rec2 n=1 Tax=Comamonas endophytica TaxID=2949090 RepID=A0ABY6GB89_9BURK|nr:MULTISPECIES: DNA internalization-related competence protein ComEC/Rec2 [unclassified Acidovorax]MCD2513657.1 DNA internalization-related competence protein ComEC/Rec2 [Acidovorax sp. D4N7]UYG52334.1 DNA internalization-related competence protein ComEC/Rec2 [Acidovorax sp. 5MLIR]
MSASPGIPETCAQPLRPWYGFQAALIGLVAGAAWQVTQPALWTTYGYAALLLSGTVLAASAWAARRRAFAVPWLLWALAAACAMAVGCGARALAFQSQALAPELEGQDLRVTGIVAAMPEPAPWGLRFRFAVEHAVHATKAEAVPVQLPPLIDLTWQGPRSGTGPGPMPLSAGERWAMTVRLKAPHGLRNPHGFDQELWLWEQGVQATGYVRAGKAQAPPQRLQQTWSHPVALLRQRLRDAIVGMRAMPWEWAGVEPSGWQRARGVVAALVVGDQQAIERSDWELFRATGVAHLMSISGLHITLFAWLAAALLGWTWRLSARCCLWVPAPTAALVGGVLLALAYSALSGWGVPAQRTVTMLAVVAGLRLAGVRWPWYQTWLLALAAVVLADPWALWQAGFWLSFVAVGVLFASAARTDPPAREVSTGRRTLDHLRSQALALLRAQAVVTLALTPLGLLLFGQVSLVGVVANLLAIPWVTLVVTPLALLGMGWAPLWQLATASVVPLHAALAWLAQMPAAQLFLPAAPLWAALAAIAGGIWLVLRLPWSLRLLGLPLLLPALSWLPARPAPGSFTLLAADIGQGNAVLVRTRSHSLLYDSGPRYGPDSDAGQRVLLPLLRAQGERLDMLMLSHGDNDHTGGAASVQRAQPQAALRGAASPEWPAAVRQAAVPCAAGQRWAWDGVAFEVLHPLPAEAMAPLPQRIGAKGRDAPNTRSCVLRIEAANGAAALLAGDIERAQESALLARAAPLRADWLLVPHHGSKTSSSAEWIAAVSPRHALVQAGYRNRYGHPAAPVVQRYREQRVNLLSSPACGAAQWSSARPQQVVCERARQPRYWQAGARK